MYRPLAASLLIHLLTTTVVGKAVGSTSRKTSKYIVGSGLDQVVASVAGGYTAQRQQVSNHTSDVRSGHGSSRKGSLYYS